MARSPTVFNHERINKNSWTIIHHNGSEGCTEKTRVEGGWLYRSQVWDKADGTSMALAFVPDKEPTKSAWDKFRYRVKALMAIK